MNGNKDILNNLESLKERLEKLENTKSKSVIFQNYHNLGELS